MIQKASTHRLEPEVQAALNQLSKILRKPKNSLINEAVKLYVNQRSREMEHELELTLEALRAYRKKDPNFDKTGDAFIDAEARFGGSDPAEGRPFRAKLRSRAKSQGVVV